MSRDSGSNGKTERSRYQLTERGAELYERVWVPTLMRRCAVDLVLRAGIAVGDQVLDVACGTGVVARAAARHTAKPETVVGVDLNPAMLRVARRLADDQGLAGITFRQADVTALPFESGCFQVVTCQQGLQFMPDPGSAMTEMARVLQPGGQLAVSVWSGPTPVGTVLHRHMDRRFGAGTTEGWRTAYDFGGRNRLRALAEAAGLSKCRVRRDVIMGRHGDPIGFVQDVIATTSLRPDVDALPRLERDRLIEDILKDLADEMDDYGLAYPAPCLILTARKP